MEQVIYPYPDFMFTTEIFTDESLPKAGSLKNNERYSSELRFRMFDEDAAFDNVIQAKEFTHFSNSFLVIASTLPLNTSKPTFILVSGFLS